MATKKVDSHGDVINGQATTSGSGKKSPYNPNSSNGDIGWSSVEVDAISDAVDAITRNGDAILFSRSMDGGVLVATVCAGSERIKFYGRTGQEMTLHLRGITVNLNARNGR